MTTDATMRPGDDEGHDGESHVAAGPPSTDHLPTPPPATGIDAVLVRFARAVDRSTEWIGSGSKYLVIAAVVIGFGNVVLRYVGRATNRGLASNTYVELQWYLYGTLFLLAFAAVLKNGINVRVDFWYAELDRRRQLLIDIVGHVFALLPFTLLGIWVSWSRVMASWGRRPNGDWPSGWRVWETWEVSSDAGGLPRAPIKSMILVAFVLLTIQALSEIAKTIVALRGHEHEVELASGMVGAVKIE